jgi:Spy/CpxP family protein refolding chaperone
MQARHGGDMDHHAMAGGMSPRHLRHLNLTEAQQDKVFEITHGQAPGRRNQGKALHKAEAELRKLTAAPDYSESKAKALADEIGKLTFEMTLARSKAERQIYELLTPEQRTQLAEMKPPHAARHHRGDGPPVKSGDQRMPAR